MIPSQSRVAGAPQNIQTGFFMLQLPPSFRLANNHEDVVWSHIAAGFKGLIPSKVKFRPQCCDDDAMIICGCMARLNKNNSDLHDLLMDYYVMGMTFMMLARKHGCSDCRIGRLLQKAEGIIDGMLMMLDIRLEME
ncbi:TPA_asm: antitermination protein [Salmonella enterica subsp. enterica serovar Napoli]|uniref:Antitermination protein n=7 Tax=Salmonella enterica TaxID=28901 RepID=A0A702QKR7_SALET|nr:antitermination protein [Salmonella enterica subsp. enterica serovar Napoli]